MMTEYTANEKRQQQCTRTKELRYTQGKEIEYKSTKMNIKPAGKKLELAEINRLKQEWILYEASSMNK